MESVTIRRYKEGDEAGIVQLLKEVFKGWPHLDIKGDPIDYWRWKYSNEYVGEKLVIVACVGGRIVGVHHGIQMRVKMFDETLNTSLGGDLAVSPEYRELGVWRGTSKLINQLRGEKNIKWHYNITESPRVIESLNKNSDYLDLPINFTNMTQIKNIEKQLDMIPMKNASVKKIGFKVVKMHNQLVHIPKSGAVERGHIKVLDIKQFDQRIDAFWEKLAEEYDYIIERDRSFLNWRYLDPRVGGFVVKQAEEEGEILGFIAMRTNRYSKEYPIGYIVDLLALPGRDDALHALLDAATKHFDGDNVNIVNCLVVKNHPNEKILNSHGFLDSRIKIKVYYNTKLAGDRNVKLAKLSPERTYISWGDYDTLPVKVTS
jgi:hypothetical protein